jgi:hypothetical protein
MPISNYAARQANRGPRFSMLIGIITNAAMAGLLMYLAPAAWITWLVGSLAITFAGFTVANMAHRNTAVTRQLTPLDFAAAWLPGIIGLTLATAGVAMMAQQSPTMRFYGLALFLVQILFVATNDQMATASPRSADRRSPSV